MRLRVVAQHDRKRSGRPHLDQGLEVAVVDGLPLGLKVRLVATSLLWTCRVDAPFSFPRRRLASAARASRGNGLARSWLCAPSS